MSRTIRRKSWNYKSDLWITHDVNFRVHGSYSSRYWVPKSEKEVKKAIAKQRSDAGYVTHSGSGRGCPKWFRVVEERKYRAKAREELCRFIKNHEYEVQIEENPHLPYWD